MADDAAARERRFANKMMIAGEVDFDSIRQIAEKRLVQREGLADSLDIAPNF